jgi:hypothetical protein
VSPQKSTNTLEAPVRTPAGPHRKPRADLYTVLLVIALIAILVAITFLWLELSYYGYKTKGGPPLAMVGTQYSVVRPQFSVVSSQFTPSCFPPSCL